MRQFYLAYQGSYDHVQSIRRYGASDWSDRFVHQPGRDGWYDEDNGESTLWMDGWLAARILRDFGTGDRMVNSNIGYVSSGNLEKVRQQLTGKLIELTCP